MHLGAGLALICGDPRSAVYGRILCVCERLGRHPGIYTMPGGRRRVGDVDIFATAMRETAEETAYDQDDTTQVSALMQNLMRFVDIDYELSREIRIAHGTTGIVYGVTYCIANIYAMPSMRLNRNAESFERVWLSIDEIADLHARGRYRGKMRRFEQSMRRLAAAHTVTLAGREPLPVIIPVEGSRLLKAIGCQ